MMMGWSCSKEDGVKSWCDDAALFDPSLHTEWVCGSSIGEDHGLHFIVEQAKNDDEFLWATKLRRMFHNPSQLIESKAFARSEKAMYRG